MAVTEVGFKTKVDVPVAGAPDTNTTLASLVTVPMVAVTTLSWAMVDTMVAVNTPALLVLPDGGANVLLLPVPESATP